MAARDPLEKARPPQYPRRRTRHFEPTAFLDRQVPVHPARFVVGMDSEERPLFPPSKQVEGTALSIAAYLGRVDEVSKRGEVTVTVWERPNGREGLTTLSVRKHLEGKRPSVGDLLWIWTWMDFLEGGEEKPKIHVEIESRDLDEADRERLRDLLAKLEESKG